EFRRVLFRSTSPASTPPRLTSPGSGTTTRMRTNATVEVLALPDRGRPGGGLRGTLGARKEQHDSVRRVGDSHSRRYPVELVAIRGVRPVRIPHILPR